MLDWSHHCGTDLQNLPQGFSPAWNYVQIFTPRRIPRTLGAKFANLFHSDVSMGSIYHPLFWIFWRTLKYVTENTPLTKSSQIDGDPLFCNFCFNIWPLFCFRGFAIFFSKSVLCKTYILLHFSMFLTGQAHWNPNAITHIDFSLIFWISTKGIGILSNIQKSKIPDPLVGIPKTND